MDDDKEYIAEMRLGVTTDTGDLEGNVKDIRPIKVTEFDLKEALRQFTVKSHIPHYSAVRYKGRKLYELARRALSLNENPEG